MGDKAKTPFAQDLTRIGTRPMREQMEFFGTCGFAKRYHYVGKLAILASKQALNNLAAKPRRAPAGGHDQDSRNFTNAGGLKVYQCRLDPPREPRIHLSVKGRPRDRGRRPRRQ